GRNIVITWYDPAAAALAPDRPFAIEVVPAPGSPQPTPIVTRLPSAQLPGLSSDGIWFFADGSLWRAGYVGGTPVAMVTGLAASQPRGQPRPAPGSQQV